MAKSTVVFLLLLLGVCGCFPSNTERNDDLKHLKLKVDKLLQENKDIKERLTVLERGMTSESSKNVDHSVDVSGGETTDVWNKKDQQPYVSVSRRKRATRRRVRQVLKQVPEESFQAVQQETANFKYNQPVVMDTVLFSKGTGYNPTSGVFTAPHSGTYLFSLNVFAGRETVMECGIFLNGRVMIRTSSQNRHNGGQDSYSFQQGSSSILLALVEGDEVAVKILYPDFGNVSLQGDSRNSFSGFLLRKHHNSYTVRNSAKVIPASTFFK